MIGTMGMQLIASTIIYKLDIAQFNGLYLEDKYFNGTELEIYQQILHHVHKHGVVPTIQVAEKFGLEVDGDYEPPSYYLELLENRYLHQQIKRALLDAQNSLKAKNPQEAFNTLNELVLNQLQSSHRSGLVNFTTDAYDMIKQEYLTKQLLGDSHGIRTGWQTMDSMFSLMPGDLMAVIGRPAAGKTYKTLYMAEHNWRLGKVPMFVSMEMKPLALAQRLASMYTHKSISQLKKGDMSTKTYKGVLNALGNLPNTEKDFWIIDGNLSETVDDIVLKARQLKPDAVYVDGAYLLKTKKNLPRWERITETCEDLKQKVATDLGIPVIASYQFNRGAVEAKSGGALEHVAGADAIGQIASVAIGLFQEEGVECIKEKEVRILKGRNGEVGSFRINWLFDEPSSDGKYMDFSEITQEDINKEQEQDLGWI